MGNFEKIIFRQLFDFSENLHKPIKSDVSDTNGRQNRVFQVQTIQNELGEVDFRCAGTHFMKFE